MRNFDALKQMPLGDFAQMIFGVVRRECETEDEFVSFLEKEIPSDLEGVVKEALQRLQCSSST
jgi:hypothetical protein